jgi:hypothetical protein
VPFILSAEGIDKVIPIVLVTGFQRASGDRFTVEALARQ